MSSNQIIVHKGRTNVIRINLGINVEDDAITSEIRSEPQVEAPLIATWNVTKPNGGADGVLSLSLDDEVTSEITATSGFMDLKRIVSGEPVPVFDEPLEVVFRGTVTQ